MSVKKHVTGEGLIAEKLVDDLQLEAKKLGIAQSVSDSSSTTCNLDAVQ